MLLLQTSIVPKKTIHTMLNNFCLDHNLKPSIQCNLYILLN